jgi:energy-coupling factor transporter ATP-binding protein EcfA2
MGNLVGGEAADVRQAWFRAVVQLLRAANAAVAAAKLASNAGKAFAADLMTKETSTGLRDGFAKCAAAYKALQIAHTTYDEVSTRIKHELQAVIDKQSAVEGWEDFLDLASRQGELWDVLREKYATEVVVQQHARALKDIDRALERVLEAKFSALSAGVLTWWERLRPEEKTFFHSVKQRPKARRTVDFKAGLSLGQDRTKAPLRDAVAVLSQSQLHCLGLASFLARSSREPIGFVVFDDPVVSSDEDYRAHFVCTVLDELVKSGQQVILLTQDQRTWKDVADLYASVEVDVFQITRDTGVTKVAKTSDDLLAMLAKAEPYVRNEHPELRKRAAEILRDAVERFCKEMLVKSQREQGDATAIITAFDGKTLGELFPKVYPLLKDASHAGKLKVMERVLNPGKHDDVVPSRGDLTCALGDLKKFRQDYLT